MLEDINLLIYNHHSSTGPDSTRLWSWSLSSYLLKRHSRRMENIRPKLSPKYFRRSAGVQLAFSRCSAGFLQVFSRSFRNAQVWIGLIEDSNHTPPFLSGWEEIFFVLHLPWWPISPTRYEIDNMIMVFHLIEKKPARRPCNTRENQGLNQ